MGLEALNATADALETFGAQIGAYPYNTLDVVAVDIWAAGLEYPQLIMMNADYYIWSDEFFHGYFHDNFRIKLAHEVAHQWFYGVVGNDQYDEAWLDESLASYMESIYANKAGVNYSIPYTELLAPLDSSIASLPRDIYQSVVYTAGNDFLHDLCDVIGEEAFNSALRKLYMTYGYGILNTDAVIRIFKDYTPNNNAEEVEKLIAEYFN